jgi:hypothetical protein
LTQLLWQANCNNIASFKISFVFFYVNALGRLPETLMIKWFLISQKEIATIVINSQNVFFLLTITCPLYHGVKLMSAGDQ